MSILNLKRPSLLDHSPGYLARILGIVMFFFMPLKAISFFESSHGVD